MKPTYFGIRIDLFETSVMVFVNCDGKKLRSVYRQWKAAPEQMKAVEGLATWWDNYAGGKVGTGGCAQSTPEGCVVLLLLDAKDRTQSIVSHEMLHAAWTVMKGAAINPNDATEEVLAYLVGFLTSKALRGIEKFASAKKKKK